MRHEYRADACLLNTQCHAGCHTVTSGASQTNGSKSGDLKEKELGHLSLAVVSLGASAPKKHRNYHLRERLRNMVLTIITISAEFDSSVALSCFLPCLDFMKLRYRDKGDF